MRRLVCVGALATMLGRASPAAAQAEPPRWLQLNGYVDVPFALGLTSIYGFSELAVASGMVASMRGYRRAPVVWATGVILTLSTGYLRLAADKHYLSDVVTGTSIGSTVGFFVPYLFHAPRPPLAAGSPPPTGKAASALATTPLFAFSGTW